MSGGTSTRWCEVMVRSGSSAAGRSSISKRCARTARSASSCKEAAMGEIRGLGMPHFPPLGGRDEGMAGILKRALADPALPERYRQPSGWPEAMGREYGSDEGRSAAVQHREFLVTHFRKMRRLLDDFRPDFIVLWGDDQYENFKEDIIPPFCVLACESFAPQPWAHASFVRANVWDEPKDTTFRVRGHRSGAKALAEGLLAKGVDVSYAYRPLHHELGHAFLTAKNYFLYPDIPADRVLYGALQRGDWATWRETPLSAMEESGQQELLNWMCLAGAMAELGRKPDETAWVETHIFNSNKCFASFRP